MAEKSVVREYPYIWAWGFYMGSLSYYMIDQVKQAKEDNAPQNAVYRLEEGGWRTADELVPPLRSRLESYLP